MLKQTHKLLLETNCAVYVQENIPPVFASKMYSIHCVNITKNRIMQWSGVSAAWFLGSTINSDELCSIYDIHTSIWKFL